MPLAPPSPPPRELMTPNEAADWFRRSTSWLRQQRGLLRVGGRTGQPLYHVQVCRAYLLGKLQNLRDAPLMRLQLHALAAACGLSPQAAARDLLMDEPLPDRPDDRPEADPWDD